MGRGANRFRRLNCTGVVRPCVRFLPAMLNSEVCDQHDTGDGQTSLRDQRARPGHRPWFGLGL